MEEAFARKIGHDGFEFVALYPIAARFTLLDIQSTQQFSRRKPRRGHDFAHEPCALLAARTFKFALPRIGCSPASRVFVVFLQAGAHIEQRVIPASHIFGGACALHKRAQLLVGHAFDITEEAVNKHRAHVRLEIQAGNIARERRDTRRGGVADAGKLHELIDAFGHAPSVFRGTYIGSALQRERAAVVAQALPLLNHIGRARRRERVNRGKMAQEPLPSGKHARHLRLLQHGFRNPNGICVARIAPGKVAIERLPRLAHPRLEFRDIGIAGLTRKKGRLKRPFNDHRTSPENSFSSVIDSK